MLVRKIMKKRLAFVMYEMTIGGTEKVLAEMLKNIDYKRYDVDLWVCKPNGEFSHLVPKNVEIRCYGEHSTKEQMKLLLKKGDIGGIACALFYRIILRFFANNWMQHDIYAAKARRSGERYDCVIAYQAISFHVVTAALYQLNAPKKIAWLHGFSTVKKDQISIMHREYGRFDRIFHVSEACQQRFCEVFSGMREKTAVFYNMYDAQDVNSKANCAIEEELAHTSITTVGRLSKEKGQQMVPATVRLLLDAGYDVYWYLVGDGYLREEVESEIKKHHVENHVILLGAQMNPYPYIKNCDIYVQPSFIEGYCTTTVEAKILHKPIVTTDAPGMREQFISGENGLIVDTMTPEALAEGIKKLLNHPELREKFRDALKKESHDNSRELQKLYDFIES